MTYNNKPLKIFIEPDEEIVFIIEKILNAPTNRVILIVPSTAALISSAVSLKILSRQLLRTPKLAILVSDNEGSFGLGEKAGLIISKRVSEITKESWMASKVNKDKMIDEINRIKAELLGERVVDDEDIESQTDQIQGQEKPAKLVKAEILDEPTPTNFPAVEKPRIKAKVVDIGNLKIYSGGDINEHVELLELERNRNNPEKVVNLTSDSELANQDKDMDRRNPGLVGQDVTEQLNSVGDTFRTRTRNSSGAFFVKIKEFFQRIGKIVSFKKFIIGFILAFVAFFGVSFYFFSSVDINIKFSENKLSAKKSITGKKDVTQLDIPNLIVPATEITKESTLSSEALTTGKGAEGESAKGSVALMNTSNKPVTIKAGTILTYQNNTALKYKTQEDITIDALKGDTRTIVAETFGEQYNIKETLQDFTISGFADVTASNISQISGGTKTEINVLAKSDIEALKASMVEQVKTTLLADIKNLLSVEDQLLLGSEKFTEVSFTTNVKENEKADNFTADIKMTLSIMRVTKTDLKTILTESLKSEYSVAKVSVSEPVIENIVIKDNIATFDIKANASTANDIDLEILKVEIKGKSVNEAKEYIKNISGIEQVTIRYNPSYIPYAWQMIPDDVSKISMTKTSALD